jgi:hypothetical protein
MAGHGPHRHPARLFAMFMASHSIGDDIKTEGQILGIADHIHGQGKKGIFVVIPLSANRMANAHDHLGRVKLGLGGIVIFHRGRRGLDPGLRQLIAGSTFGFLNRHFTFFPE